MKRARNAARTRQRERVYSSAKRLADSGQGGGADTQNPQTVKARSMVVV